MANKIAFTSYESNTIGDKLSYKKRFANAASFIFKAGLCIGACAIALIAAQNDKNELAALTQAHYEADENDELGKLKFVSYPGVISVFAPKNNLQAPLANAEVEFADSYAVFTSKSDQQILSMINGEVRYIDEDDTLGGLCVSIVSANDDMEMIISGMTACIIEEGQHVKKGDSIGAALSLDEVVVKLLKEGRPVDMSTELLGGA